MAEQRVHSHPRMGINALAQYVSASPAKRERILHDQKYPPAYQVRWYEYATRAIVRYLADADHDPEILTRAEERIRAMPTPTDNEAQKVRNNASAVAVFATFCSEINFTPLDGENGPMQGKLVVEGVTISVRPDIVLAGQYRNCNALGAIKLYLSKDVRLEETGIATVGAVLHQYLQESAPPDATCPLRHCIVIDVFGRVFTTAPRAIIRTRRDVDAGCREIAQRWPTI